MCIGIAMRNGGFYFGRNMDIDYEFGERVVITPRNYPFIFRRAGAMKHHYAMIGMAAVIDGYPLYAEAANEKGLCAAGLNFPGNAYYSSHEKRGRFNISPFELIPWLLGQCSTAAEAGKLLDSVNLIEIPFRSDIPLTPLHWLISDKTSSIVLESAHNGMHIYDNPVDVLTNNPTFDFHLTNLGQYLNLTTELPENCYSKKLGIRPFGRGLGSFGLPGDFSPASRFVKASYLLLNSDCDENENSCISQLFHILDSVSVVSGGIAPKDNMRYYTTYSCCINADKGIYYYKTYFNNQLTAVDMSTKNLDADSVMEFSLVREQQINFE